MGIRWNEKEAYKLLKSRIEIERFTGKKAKAIKQDLQAKVCHLFFGAFYTGNQRVIKYVIGMQ